MTISQHFLKYAPLTIIFLGSISINKVAAEPTPRIASEVTSSNQTKPVALGEQLENLGRLYKNEENDILQELWILGRYHGQYHWSEGSVAEDDGYETRRFRLGSQARLFKKMTVHAQAISDNWSDKW